MAFQQPLNITVRWTYNPLRGIPRNRFGRGASEKDRKAPRRRPTSPADLAIKERALARTKPLDSKRALARTKPLDSKPGRYRPPDALLGFLDGL